MEADALAGDVYTWKEEDHERNELGQFTSKGGGSGGGEILDLVARGEKEEEEEPVERSELVALVDKEQQNAELGPEKRELAEQTKKTQQNVKKGGEKPESAAKAEKENPDPPQSETEQPRSPEDLATAYKNLTEAKQLEPILSEMGKLNSEEETDRREACKKVLAMAATVEAKDPILAKELRDLAKGAVDTMYHIVNQHTLDRADAEIQNYFDGKLNARQMAELPLEEQVAMLMILYKAAEESEELKEMVKDPIKALGEILVLSDSLKGVLNLTEEEAAEKRKALIPPRYEEETRRKVVALTETLRRDEGLRADADTWEDLDERLSAGMGKEEKLKIRAQKEEILTRWVNAMTAELGIPGEYSFETINKRGGIRVVPIFRSEKEDNTRYIFSTEKVIQIRNDGWNDLNSGSLYRGLYPVLHEVMHAHEANYMHPVLRSRNADPQEREYALKAACSTMVPEPTTAEAYNGHLAESSAIYFSDMYINAMEDIIMEYARKREERRRKKQP